MTTFTVPMWALTIRIDDIGPEACAALAEAARERAKSLIGDPHVPHQQMHRDLIKFAQRLEATLDEE